MVVWRSWIQACVVSGLLCMGMPAKAEVSALNLSPGFPTSLDDAYPINSGTMALQPALGLGKTERGDARFRQTVDMRWGVTHGMELFVGATGIRGALQPGTLDDPRAVRAGLMYRMYKQQGAGAWMPSLALRTTVQVPYGGPESHASLRSELLASWDLSHEWWGHVNVGYQLVPGGQVGLQGPGRNALWYGRIGVVKAIGRNVGLVGGVSYSQDYTQANGTLITPEVGLTYGFAQNWIATIGAGRDFGGSNSEATVKGNVGISFVW